MTHFRAVYRRHTNFAMEHVRTTFTSSNLELNQTQSRTLTAKIPLYAQLLHDTYISVTLPNIWSPLKQVSSSGALGYEFRWIENIGYNMIESVAVRFNGQVIARHRGEWMKFYSYLTHDSNRRDIVDEMTGNVNEIHDPANAYDRVGQYPHAIAPTMVPTTLPMDETPEPSIRSRQLLIPLHFWFCENSGTALPLSSMQNTEVYIDVTFRPLEQLYTVIDVDPNSTTYGKRVKPSQYPIGPFLSPPTITGTPSNPTLTNFFPDPYLECNYIFLTESEMQQLVAADQTFLFKEITFVEKDGQFGANSDLDLPVHNLVTRIVFATHRLDNKRSNDWDNYTNWENPRRAPFTAVSSDKQLMMYSSGQQQISSQVPRDTVANAELLLDGKERLKEKPIGFFSLLQAYRHTKGAAPHTMPGIYMYSFALDHDQYQPSGALNASMFNKLTLRTSLQQPPAISNTTTQETVCILRSTALSSNPVIVQPGQLATLNPQDVIEVVRTKDDIIFGYTYSLMAYVESYNFLRIVSGLANLVFAS